MSKRYEWTAASPSPRSVRPELVEGRRALRAPVAAALLAAAASSCVTVEAPDKPIVIELNVNIRQEVIYRLAADAKNTVEENEDIF